MTSVDTEHKPTCETGCFVTGRDARFVVKDVIQQMKWIEPGSFLMGSPDHESERRTDEKQHEVRLTKGFWLADTACSQAMWQAVMGDNPSRFKDGDRPVEQVCWNDVLAFIDRLNRQNPELALRLPSEAEWEYACRAGAATPFGFGDTLTSSRVNYDGHYPYGASLFKGCYRAETVRLKALPANGWGLYQMHGNVWEWCADRYGPYPMGPVVDPSGPELGENRVLRGGSWISLGRFVRSACRDWSHPDIRYDDRGFRLARGQRP